MRLLAIDPGCDLSAWVVWDGERIHDCAKEENENVLALARGFVGPVYVEGMSYMRAEAGASMLGTAFWAGRFYQASADPQEVKRTEVKLHHTGRRTANDSDVRAALIDRFGRPYTTEVYTPTGKRGQPLKPRSRRAPGLTAPLSNDTWQAFALAVYATDKAEVARRVS